MLGFELTPAVETGLWAELGLLGVSLSVSVVLLVLLWFVGVGGKAMARMFSRRVRRVVVVWVMRAI